MKKFATSLFFLITLCLVDAKLSATIIECQRLHEILPLIENDTLVVFNINNVLTVSYQDAGSTPWAEEHIAKLTKELNTSKAHATNLFIPLWHDILVVTDVELFDPEAEAIVSYLQGQGVKTMALTNRYTEMAYSTHRNLRSVGIDFTKTAPFQEDCWIQDVKSPSKYIEGLIFNGLINFKGDTLAAFLKQINYTPKKLIYIEDKPKHLAQMEECITALGIPFVGVHFGALELQRESYRPELANTQVKFHQDILDDNSAQKICGANRTLPKVVASGSDQSNGALPDGIHIIHSINELDPQLNENDLLVTELDHVLWQTNGSIGARQFFDHYLNKQKMLGYSSESARNATVHLVEKIHRRAQVSLINEESASFFNKLSQKKCWSVAISYRPSNLLSRTIEQADHLKLHFNPPFEKDGFQNQGIICANGAEGQFKILEDKLSQLKTKPRQLVGLSSTLSDLLKLQVIAKTKGIPFQGYLLQSSSTNEFLADDEMLTLELECLDRLLTNEEAQLILSK